MRRALTFASIAVLGLASVEVRAHWCSNIFAGPARFVIKPETTTLAVNNSAQLRVYLQNNFPFTLFNVQLRGVASGFTISTSPAGRTIYPGQNVSYILTVNGNGNVTMTMQMAFRLGSWRGPSDKLVNQNPTQALLAGNAVYNQGSAEQTPSLNLGTLLDRYPSATLGGGAPTFGRNAPQQLIKMFGYRYCWDEGGSWIGGSQDCPSPVGEATWGNPYDISQFPQDCMRAGVELGVHKSQLGSSLQAARDGAVNALQGAGSGEHKCLAAVVGGYLWQGAADISPFRSALQNGSNGVPGVCQTAGLRAAGDNNSPQNCPSSPYPEEAACAAAEGIRNNDGPVTSILMPSSGDNDHCGSYSCGYYAYMLYLVQGVRKASGGVVPFYPDAGVSVDQPQPPVDQPKPPPDQPRPPVDQPVPKKDQAVAKKDQAVAKKDTATPPGLEPRPPKRDTVGPPPSETGVDTVDTEAGLPGQEAGPPRTEAGSKNNNNGARLLGGCGCVVGQRDAASPLLHVPSPLLPLAVAAFVAVVLTRSRKRKPR